MPVRESEITLERIRKILAAGANVVLTTKGIDDLCLKEFVEAGAMAVRQPLLRLLLIVPFPVQRFGQSSSTCHGRKTLLPSQSPRRWPPVRSLVPRQRFARIAGHGPTVRVHARNQPQWGPHSVTPDRSS